MRARLTILIGALVMVAGVLTAGQTSQAQTMLEAGRKLEVVDGNLSGAIKQYQAVVDKFSKTDAASTATALLRMAECYQKLGDAQARSIYERLLRDFGSQPEAAEARARLATLSTGSSQSSRGKTDRVVWSEATVYDPLAVSQDGRWLVTSDYDTKGENLNIVDLQTGVSRHLMDSREGYSIDDVSVSRDGAHVACASSHRVNGKQADELRLFDVQGTSPPTSKVLWTDDGEVGIVPYDWTADGQSILVGLYYHDHSQIGFMSTRDGSVRVVKPALPPGPPVGTIKLSPDDKYIAVDERHNDVRVSVMAADGTGEVPAVVSRTNDLVAGWSPDSSRLLFTSDRTGTIGLYAQRMSDGKPQGAPEILTAEFGRTIMLQTTSTGALFYYPRPVNGVGGGIKTATIDFATGTVVSPPVDVLDESGIGRITSPAFAPDGTRLAYAWMPTGMLRGETHLVVKALDSRQRHISNLNLNFASWLIWAPDGTALAVYGQSYDGELGMWKVDPGTGERSPLILGDPDTDVGFHRWSADSKTVYLIRVHKTAKELALIEHNVATGTERELFRGSSAQGSPNPQVSPDGKTVYFKRAVDGTKPPLVDWAYIARDVASGSEREIARGYFGGVVLAPGGVVLSPDGRFIATGVTDPATASRSIRVMPVDGSQPRDVIRVDVTREYLDGTSTVDPLAVALWTADSRSILVQKAFQSGTSPVRREVWWAPIDGRSEPKLVDLGQASNVQINRDGMRVAFQAPGPRPTEARPPLEVHALEHFLPGGK
jgi:Tol biopolymer transport system component